MEIYVSLSDSKLNVLKNLKPDSVITLFHGASFGVALDMCHNGIDGRRKLYRHYPHYTTNAKGERIMVDRGVFCTHDLKVAKTSVVNFSQTPPDAELGTDDLICQSGQLTIEGLPPATSGVVSEILE